MKINSLIKREPHALRRFCSKHPDELFTQNELANASGSDCRVRDMMPRAWKIKIGSRTYYGCPAAIEAYKKAQQQADKQRGVS